MTKDKKDLNSKIEDLFAEIGAEEPTNEPHDTAKLNGWTWECDSEAYYTTCSPEIIDYIGVSARRFTGKSFYSYRLHPQSILSVRRALNEEIYPQELSVYFEGENGIWVMVRMHISRRLDAQNKVLGWSGFNLLIKKYKPGELERELGEDYGLPPIPPPPGSRPKPTFRPHGPAGLTNGENTNNAGQERKSTPLPPFLRKRSEQETTVEATEEKVEEALTPTHGTGDNGNSLPEFLVGREPAPAAPLTPNRIRFTSGKYGYEAMERLPYPTKDEQYLTYVPIANQAKKKQTILLEVLFALLVLVLAGLLVAMLLGTFN